jgi:hypothetical protein
MENGSFCVIKKIHFSAKVDSDLFMRELGMASRKYPVTALFHAKEID